MSEIIEAVQRTENRNQTVKQKKLSHWIDRYGEMSAVIVSGVLIGLAWIIGYFSIGISICLYLLAYIVGGYVKAKEGYLTLVHKKDLDVNLLMIVAAIGAACIGYWAEGAVLIFIFSLSGALETLTMARSSRDISALKELKPETAVLFHLGKEKQVPIEELTVGDMVVVKTGERIPADGIVKEGKSVVNQASITGESMPVDKAVGDEVFAGTLNGEGALFVEVSKSSESTLFSKIIRLVQEAQNEMPKSQRFIEKFERIYARFIIISTAILIAVPYWLMGWDWSTTFYRAMVFLVVASPCALVASIMPAMLSAISNCARKGLLLKGGLHLENLSGIKLIAFDKTGTLTYGKPLVTDIFPFQQFSESQLLQVSASIESLTTHPIAKAIVQKASEMSVTLIRPTDFQALTGWGVQAKMYEDFWRIGKPGMFDDDLCSDPIKSQIYQLEQQGKTVILVANTVGIAGIIALQDRIRPQVKNTIFQLRRLGIQVAMLTGDQKRTAEAIACEAGIDLVYAELLPTDKLDMIKRLKEEYSHVAMVGDGVNDAPALATASVGIAMGVAGSDVALETADLVLMNDDLEKIKEAIVLGRRMKLIVKQNLVFAVLVITSLILSNFIMGVPLPLGVVGHEGSTILVILNGLRLLR
ncbi:heavy metal translocating P-type ATPase [Paenibacillus sp. MCAF9]|uniref:heavy metal translocating P-type ATPase n=1 Tax=Paenibacillus sp. MCAF9 TaxID=3233046 RepID=UPI003F9B5FC7